MVRWLLHVRVTLVSAHLEVGVRLAPCGIRMELILCYLVNCGVHIYYGVLS